MNNHMILQAIIVFRFKGTFVTTKHFYIFFFFMHQRMPFKRYFIVSFECTFVAFKTLYCPLMYRIHMFRQMIFKWCIIMTLFTLKFFNFVRIFMGQQMFINTKTVCRFVWTKLTRIPYYKIIISVNFTMAIQPILRFCLKWTLLTFIFGNCIIMNDIYVFL